MFQHLPAEQGPSADTTIGTSHGRRGTLRFTPGDGSAERRKIVAVVKQDGMPRDQIAVASYRAPGAPRPARPHGLSLRRAGSALKLSWRGASARRYQATVRLSDGRRLLVRSERRQVTVPRVGRRVRGTVAVRGLSRSGMAALPAVQRRRARR